MLLSQCTVDRMWMKRCVNGLFYVLQRWSDLQVSNKTSLNVIFVFYIFSNSFFAFSFGFFCLLHSIAFCQLQILHTFSYTVKKLIKPKIWKFEFVFLKFFTNFNSNLYWKLKKNRYLNKNPNPNVDKSYKLDPDPDQSYAFSLLHIATIFLSSKLSSAKPDCFTYIFRSRTGLVLQKHIILAHFFLPWTMDTC